MGRAPTYGRGSVRFPPRRSYSPPKIEEVQIKPSPFTDASSDDQIPIGINSEKKEKTEEDRCKQFVNILFDLSHVFSLRFRYIFLLPES